MKGKIGFMWKCHNLQGPGERRAWFVEILETCSFYPSPSPSLALLLLLLKNYRAVVKGHMKM